MQESTFDLVLIYHKKKKRNRSGGGGQRDGEGHFSNRALKDAASISPPAPRSLRVARLPEAASTPSPLLPSSQLRALTASLLEGRELPDAAVLQQWLDVLVTAPLGGVRQAAADAAAALLGSTAFAVFRDE